MFTGTFTLLHFQVARQLSSALEFLHSKQLVHRDIKLENILVFAPDLSTIKLCDFGETRKEGEQWAFFCKINNFNKLCQASDVGFFLTTRADIEPQCMSIVYRFIGTYFLSPQREKLTLGCLRLTKTAHLVVLSWIGQFFFNSSVILCGCWQSRMSKVFKFSLKGFLVKSS